MTRLEKGDLSIQMTAYLKVTTKAGLTVFI
jgi:hypothetical protein